MPHFRHSWRKRTVSTSSSRMSIGAFDFLTAQQETRPWYSPSPGQIYCLGNSSATHDITSNSYTMGCPPARGDNPRALASGLSYVQVDKHGITILYHLHQCRHCTLRDISC